MTKTYLHVHISALSFLLCKYTNYSPAWSGSSLSSIKTAVVINAAGFSDDLDWFGEKNRIITVIKVIKILSALNYYS